MIIRLWLPVLLISVLRVISGDQVSAGEERTVDGLARVADVLLDTKDPDPSRRIAALLTESALTIDPKLTGAEYVRTKLPDIFARQMRQARERQPDSSFRDPNMRLFGLAPNPESLATVGQQVVGEFGGLKQFPQRRLEEAFARIPLASVESGEVFGFYDARNREVPTVLLLMIFNREGHIVLIDEL